MQCPKCENTMTAVQFGSDIKIMRCVGCAGLLCENGVLEKMRDEWLVETVLDTGSAEKGRQNNKISGIDCPICQTTMKHVQDEEQTHITLDVCPECEALFLDAGELTDIKSVTLMDQVWRLLKKFRK